MSHRTWLISSFLALTLAPLLAACESVKVPMARTTTRAMWVTRFDYRTKEDLTRIVVAAESAGINQIMFQVRGNGTAAYRSSYEPWSEQFNFTDPGFDPLSAMIQEAHARSIKVHAWVNVMPAWTGLVAPKDQNQLWHKRPEWMWYGADGQRQPLVERFYVSLNPCLPEVRRYLVDVMKDLVGRYPVDGLHLDYIRFPNEKAAGVDYPRDARTLALFEADTGSKPDQDRAAWNRWRAEQVSELMREVRYMLKRANPACELSAAVGPVPERALAEHFQDTRTWIDERLVDVVYPMNYTDDQSVFRQRAEVWKAFAKGTPVVMGLRVGSKDIDGQIAQVEESLRSFNGYCIFAYNLVFDSPNDAVEGKDEGQRFERSQIRKALLPRLKALAVPGAAHNR